MSLDMAARIMRPAGSSYVVFWIIAGVPAAALLDDCVRHGANCWMVPVGGLMLLFVTVWIWSYQITLDGETLIYRSLFRGTQSIRRQQIRRVIYSAGIRTWADRFGPWSRIEIYCNDGPRPIIINRKIFKTEDLSFLRDYLRGVPA